MCNYKFLFYTFFNRIKIILYIPKQYPVFDLVIKCLSLGINGQQMLQIGIVRQVGVNPVAKRQLLLEPDGMRGALAGRLGDSAQSLEILLLRDHLLKRGAQFVGFQFFAELLELFERETTFVLQPLLIVVFLYHLAHLVSGHLEAAHVQRVSQLGDVDEAISVCVDLSEKKGKTISYADVKQTR